MSKHIFAIATGILMAIPGLVLSLSAADKETLVIGSKDFTESRLLGEIMAQVIENNTTWKVERRLGLGGTMICFSALREGEIDLYAEYTGTGLVAILKQHPGADPLYSYYHVRQEFQQDFGLDWLDPFGFNNTYALAMRRDQADQLGIRRISDLNGHPELRIGFNHEFLNREDGWVGLRETYDLSLPEPRGIGHGLVYPAIAEGQLDLVNVYTTDGKLEQYDLTVLEDDRLFFPSYHAAPLIRLDLLDRAPELRQALAGLSFSLSDERMRQLNAEVEIHGHPIAEVATKFLRFLDEGRLDELYYSATGVVAAATAPPSARSQGFQVLMHSRLGATLGLLWEHLRLTGISVLLACAFGVPLGITIVYWRALSAPVLWITGIIQTIPSLALLAFMIPLLGLGFPAAIAALFLYALLPIVRNTFTGIKNVDADLLEAARGMGLTRWQMLRLVQLPLATGTIMAGVRTSTVISVGVATLAAFVGAGGLGEPIVTGLQLNDVNLILTGALPAALLAVLIDFALGRVERRLAPRGV